VALLARDREKLDGYAGHIASSGGRAVPVPADVSRAEQIHDAFDRIRTELGDVDVLVYNAATRRSGASWRRRSSS